MGFPLAASETIAATMLRHTWGSERLRRISTVCGGCWLPMERFYGAFVCCDRTLALVMRAMVLMHCRVLQVLRVIRVRSVDVANHIELYWGLLAILPVGVAAAPKQMELRRRNCPGRIHALQPPL